MDFAVSDVNNGSASTDHFHDSRQSEQRIDQLRVALLVRAAERIRTRRRSALRRPGRRFGRPERPAQPTLVPVLGCGSVRHRVGVAVRQAAQLARRVVFRFFQLLVRLLSVPLVLPVQVPVEIVKKFLHIRRVVLGVQSERSGRQLKKKKAKRTHKLRKRKSPYQNRLKDRANLLFRAHNEDIIEREKKHERFPLCKAYLKFLFARNGSASVGGRRKD